MTSFDNHSGSGYGMTKAEGQSVPTKIGAVFIFKDGQSARVSVELPRPSKDTLVREIVKALKENDHHTVISQKLSDNRKTTIVTDGRSFNEVMSFIQNNQNLSL